MTTIETDTPTAAAIEIEGLHATTPQRLSFAPSLEVRAYQLERPAGNILIYNTGALADDAAELGARGGVARQYLGHWHEATFGLRAEALGAKLLHHMAETPHVREFGSTSVTFSRRHHLDEDFEAIPIPGHTPGSTAYLWQTGGHRLLFSADSIYLEGDRWRVALLESSDRDAYIASLEQLREVEFDVLVPWAAKAGGPAIAEVSEAERLGRIDALIAWLEGRETR